MPDKQPPPNVFQLYERIIAGEAAVERTGPALWVDAADYDEAAIPCRPWLAEGYLLRGSVTVLAGLGSAGKSSLLMGWAVSCALGEPYGRFAPRQVCRTLIYNVEDDQDEQRRRLSAALRQFGRTPRDLGGRIMRCGPISVGMLLERDGMTHQLAATHVWDALEAQIDEAGADILVADPMVELHNGDENDNAQLRQVMARFRELAKRRNMAVVLVHHARKGGEAGDVDSIRGAGSIVGAARITLTIAPMSEEEAADLGIAKATRRSYFRVDSVKANYGGARDADWYELTAYTLDNGEDVAAAVPWAKPKPIVRGVDADVVDLIAADVARGTGTGPYSPKLGTSVPRSVSLAMVRHGVARPQDQKAVLNTMLAQGWRVAEFKDGTRHIRNGLRSPEGLPAATWSTTNE